MRQQEYVETTGELARASGVTVQTIVTYADAELLDYIRLANRTRLFRAGQATRVREILAQRMASRGRRSASAAA